MFWKSCILTLRPPVLAGGGGGSAGKIFPTMLLHVCFLLIWYATWPYSEKGEFWAFEPTTYVHPGDQIDAFDLKPRLICFLIILPLSACDNSVKMLTTDWVIVKFQYFTFDPT